MKKNLTMTETPENWILENMINEAPVLKKDSGEEYYRIDSKEKPTAVIFGKFSPWTGPKGHGRLVKFAEEKFGHGNYVIVSPKRKGADPRVDIFNMQQKQEIIAKANPGAKVIQLEPNSPYGMLIELVKQGIKRPVFIVGPDRVDEFRKFFREYKKNETVKEAKEVPENEKGEYAFIQGERATSATLVRKALITNNKAEFLNLTGYDEKMWRFMRGLLKVNNVVSEKFTNFETFYNENMNEGALGGHLSHPYEVLSVDDFLDFYKKLLSGKLEATEKVDGVNLFVGFNERGKLVFARNRSELPSENIEKKFSVDHPGGDAFRAGFAALKQAFEGLKPEERVKYDLINKDGSPKNYLNLEVVYGTIPNLIQYSDTNNYIVFHAYQGTPEEDYKNKPKNDKLLTDLANRLGKVEVKSDVVSYVGTVREVKKIVENKTSTWIFKGPLFIPTSKISIELETVAKEFENYSEVQDLKKWDSLTKEQQSSLMKSLTTKIGSKVLVNLASMLFSGKRVTDKDHPKTEGIVVNFKGNLVKLTGDFSELNRELWGPLKDGLDSSLKSLNKYVLNDLLSIPYVTIKKSDWNDNDANAKKYLLHKGNAKAYKNSDAVFEKVNTAELSTKIEQSFKTIEKLYGDISEKNIKKHDILKALRIAGYKLTVLQKKLPQIKTRHDLLEVWAEVMFGLKSGIKNED